MEPLPGLARSFDPLLRRNSGKNASQLQIADSRASCELVVLVGSAGALGLKISP
jgi:hypothetical protein